MIPEKPNQRRNLEKYYDVVLKCITCGKLFGLDKKSKSADWKFCPVCCNGFYSRRRTIPKSIEIPQQGLGSL